MSDDLSFVSNLPIPDPISMYSKELVHIWRHSIFVAKEIKSSKAEGRF